jgi:protein-S-isoprenylcysteine O-methyltransferase Ste14
MVRREAFWPLAKTAVFTILVPYTVAWYLPHWVDSTYAAYTDAIRSHAWALLLGFLVFLIGLAIYLWCAWDFAVTGLGTPAPIDAPRVLVVKGLYQYVRNPMYLGVICLIASRALFRESYPIMIYLIFVAACFHLFVIAYEEPHLKRIFGEQYDDYCKRVPRWLPRLSATK